MKDSKNTLTTLQDKKSDLKDEESDLSQSDGESHADFFLKEKF